MSGPFDEMLIHPLSKKQLVVFINQPKHALLISGPAGSGKTFVATKLATELLVSTTSVNNHPYFFFISKADDKSEISINEIRQLINKLSLRVVGDKLAARPINRVALIENAHYLSREAQNAVLKLLEEPPEGTLIILTAVSEEDVLPTVASRAQKINLIPVDLHQSLKYFGPEYPTSKIETEWQLSQGTAGLLSALLKAEETHPLKEAVKQAKDFLKQSSYERLIFIQRLAKNKDGFIIFLDALSKVLAALQQATIQKGSAANTNKILVSRRQVIQAHQLLQGNANSRLIGLSLAVNIPL